MTKEKERDYWKCPDGATHTWRYLGRARQAYRCWNCELFVSKLQLKEATDA